MRVIPVPENAPGRKSVAWTEDPLDINVRSWEFAAEVDNFDRLHVHAFVELDDEDIMQIIQGHKRFRVEFVGEGCIPAFAVSGIEPEWTKDSVDV